MSKIKDMSEARKIFDELSTKLEGLKSFLESPMDDSHLPIIDRVKTFDDIERISGIKLIKREDETPDEYAYRQVKLIAQVYNEGETLDPIDTNQWKYYPWHRINNESGVGLSDDDCDYWYSFSFVGVRLCFKSSELATDAGQKFIEIYSQLKIK